MDRPCEIVDDLLPLYLDGVCSAESRRLVGEHLAACPACRQRREAMERGIPEGNGPVPGEEAVLKRTARTLRRRAAGSALGVTAIVLYWLVYFWQDSLSNAGDYRFFSYAFHELWTAGTILVPLLTLLWLGTLLCRTAKRHTWRRSAALLLVLAMLLAGQAGYLHRQSQMVQVTSWTEVESIPDAYHVVIWGGSGAVTLATTPAVTALLEPGAVYGFTYEQSLRTPDRGTLSAVARSD